MELSCIRAVPKWMSGPDDLSGRYGVLGTYLLLRPSTQRSNTSKRVWLGMCRSEWQAGLGEARKEEMDTLLRIVKNQWMLTGSGLGGVSTRHSICPSQLGCLVVCRFNHWCP